MIRYTNENNELITSSLNGRFWLISADMGYGHLRAIYPLKNLAYDGEILNANKMPHASVKERRLWNSMLNAYEFVSRAVKLPLIGRFFSGFLDSVLYIPKYYPFSDRSYSTYQVRYLRRRIKNGLTNGVLDQIESPGMPLITSFYAIAIAAEISGHKNIFSIICDTDINRVWVAEKASTSNIVYFASGSVSEQRLISYGVPEEKIQLTGFPLPLELLGNRSLNILKTDLIGRLKTLDPNGIFYNLYKHSINAFLPYEDSIRSVPDSDERCVTITYSVGGAGAQKEIGEKIALSLSKKINDGQVKLNLVAGIRTDVRDYFYNVKKRYAPDNENICIIWANDNNRYFEIFNNCLHTTDILWTKPSELSFYCALGIPIIITPPIGPQEKSNRHWLREIGAGFKQQNPEYTDQWLFDLLKKGRLAEAAWLGFLKARKYGTFNIIDYLEKGSFVKSNDPLKR
jgi:hypothetical protein